MSDSIILGIMIIVSVLGLAHGLTYEIHKAKKEILKKLEENDNER